MLLKRNNLKIDFMTTFVTVCCILHHTQHKCFSGDAQRYAHTHANEHTHSCATQLDNSCDEQEFQSLLSSDEFDFRYTCGVAKPAAHIPFSEKQIVHIIWLHYTVLVCANRA